MHPGFAANLHMRDFLPLTVLSEMERRVVFLLARELLTLMQPNWIFSSFFLLSCVWEIKHFLCVFLMFVCVCVRKSLLLTHCTPTSSASLPAVWTHFPLPSLSRARLLGTLCWHKLQSKCWVWSWPLWSTCVCFFPPFVTPLPDSFGLRCFSFSFFLSCWDGSWRSEVTGIMTDDVL